MDAFVQGRLGADPESRTLSQGGRVARMNVAARQSKAERERNDPTMWINVEVWDETAERVCAQLHKGSAVLVQGVWKVARWETDAGETRTRNYVRAYAIGLDLSVEPHAAHDSADETPAQPVSAGSEPPAKAPVLSNPFDEV